MSWWYAVPIIAKGIGNIVSNNAQRRALEDQRSATASAYDTRISALDDAKKQTPAELKYFNRLESEATKGDPYLEEQRQFRTQPIHQQGQFRRQRATGTAIQQGLENSIIANELRRQVDQDTLKQLAIESDKLALHNKQYKREAQKRYDSAQMQRQNQLRQLSLQQANLESDRDLALAGIDSQQAQRKADRTAGIMSTVGELVTGYNTANPDMSLKQFMGPDGEPVEGFYTYGDQLVEISGGGGTSQSGYQYGNQNNFSYGSLKNNFKQNQRNLFQENFRSNL